MRFKYGISSLSSYAYDMPRNQQETLNFHDKHLFWDYYPQTNFTVIQSQIPKQTHSLRSSNIHSFLSILPPIFSSNLLKCITSLHKNTALFPQSIKFNAPQQFTYYAKNQRASVNFLIFGILSMSLQFQGVIQCKSEDVTPGKSSNSNELSPQKHLISKKLNQFFSTLDSHHNQHTKNQQKSSIQPIYQSIYPSAFSEEASSPIRQFLYKTPSSNGGSSLNTQNKKQMDIFDRLEKQIKQLRKNVDNLQRVTQRYTKIYHDSRVVLEDEDLEKGRIFICEERMDDEQNSADEYILGIRDKLEEILNTAIIQEQQSMKSLKSAQSSGPAYLKQINSNQYYSRFNLQHDISMTRSVQSQFYKQT